jgi:hypothetical protein
MVDAQAHTQFSEFAENSSRALLIANGHTFGKFQPQVVRGKAGLAQDMADLGH